MDSVSLFRTLYPQRSMTRLIVTREAINELCLSVEMCLLIVEKDPFGVCNDRYTSAAFG